MKSNYKKWIGFIIVGTIILTCGIKLGLYIENLAMRPGDFDYEVISQSPKTCRLTKYNGPEAVKIDIPEKIRGYQVVELGDNLFLHQLNLKGEPDIPETVTYIGAYVFSDCEGLTGELVLPEGLEVIGDKAFRGCKGLSGISEATAGGQDELENEVTSGISLPESLTSIGEYAFAYCSGFEGELDLPDGLTELGEGAFMECTGLYGNVEIPATLAQVKAKVFLECTGIDGTLTLSEGLERVGDDAFNGCKFTGNLVIPNTVCRIGERAFYDTYDNGTLTLPVKDVQIDIAAFMDCGFEGELKLPEGNTQIYRNVFRNCNFSGNLIVPEGCYLYDFTLSEVFDVSKYDRIIDNRYGEWNQLLAQGIENIEQDETLSVELEYIYFDEDSEEIYGKLETDWEEDSVEDAYIKFELLNSKLDEDIVTVPLVWGDDSCYFRVKLSEFMDTDRQTRYAMSVHTTSATDGQEQQYQIADDKYNLVDSVVADDRVVYMYYVKGGVIYIRQK